MLLGYVIDQINIRDKINKYKIEQGISAYVEQLPLYYLSDNIVNTVKLSVNNLQSEKRNLHIYKVDSLGKI